MLRPRSYRVKLIELSLHRFLFNMFAVERASKDAAQGVGKQFQRIGHAVRLLIRPKKSEAAVTQIQDNRDTKFGLDPVVDASSRIMILGTLPGPESLRLQRYYSHGPNQFWTILSRVFDEPIGTDYDERIAFLRRHGIALWDVLKSAEREGGTDSKIKNATLNNFAAFFAAYPNLRAVALTGSTAPKYWRLVTKQSGIPAALRIGHLPSTSPIPGKNVLGLDEKVARWKAFLTAKP